MINQRDQIFIYQNEENVIPSERKSYFGSNISLQNPLENLSSYIAGYQHGVNELYHSFENAGKNGQIEIQDTIIYPLLFCHRHCVELELKYLAVTYCNNDDEIRQVLSQGHDLTKIWNHISPHLKKRAGRIDYKIDFAAISHYIQEISKVDADSLNYRYPMKKSDLSSTIGSLIELDVPNMHFQLNKLHDYLLENFRHLNGQLDYLEYDKTFVKQFKSDLHANLTEINKILSIKYENKIEERNKDSKMLLQCKSYEFCNNDELKYLSSIADEVKRILLIIHFSKCYIENKHLPVDKIERRKDVFRILYAESKNVHVEDYDCIYISSKFRLILEDASWYIKIIEEIINL